MAKKDQIQTPTAAAKTPRKRAVKPEPVPTPVNPFEDILSKEDAEALVEKKGRWTNDDNIQQDCVISGIDFTDTLIAVDICVHNRKHWSDPFRVESTDFTRIVLM